MHTFYLVRFRFSVGSDGTLSSPFILHVHNFSIMIHEVDSCSIFYVTSGLQHSNDVFFFILLLLLFNVQVNLCLTNQTDKTVGPFEVFLAPSMSGEERAVLVNGLQKLVSCFSCMLFYVHR